MTTTTINPVIPNTKKSFEAIRNSNREMLTNIHNKCKNNSEILKLYNKILDNNIETLQEIESKQFTSDKHSNNKNDIINKLDALLKDVKKHKDLNLEKNTLLVITEERNKNIEMYYVIYILFITLLFIIQGSIVIFK